MELVRRTKRAEICIFMPSLAPHDAMATHVLELCKSLKQNDVKVTLYADEIKKEMKGEALPFSRFLLLPRASNRYLLYQAGTGSNIVRHLVDRAEPLMIQYHNITPRSEFVRWEPGIATSMAWGRRQLERLSGVTDLALAISEYNAIDLVKATFPRVVVSPPIIRSLDLRETERTYGVHEFKLLFVGRLAPNKAQEDLIRAVGLYNASFEDKVHLHLVGSSVIDSYSKYLVNLVDGLGLAKWVHFHRNLDSAELSELFSSSHAFVSSSNHEGFGFPFIEAMRARTPIVVVASSAIPETLGTAGILLAGNDPVEMATAWRMVLHDQILREQLIERGSARALRWDREVSALANIRALANTVPIPGIIPMPLYFDAASPSVLSLQRRSI